MAISENNRFKRNFENSIKKNDSPIKDYVSILKEEEKKEDDNVAKSEIIEIENKKETNTQNNTELIQNIQNNLSVSTSEDDSNITILPIIKNKGYVIEQDDMLQIYNLNQMVKNKDIVAFSEKYKKVPTIIASFSIPEYLSNYLKIESRKNGCQIGIYLNYLIYNEKNYQLSINGNNVPVIDYKESRRTKEKTIKTAVRIFPDINDFLSIYATLLGYSKSKYLSLIIKKDYEKKTSIEMQ